MDKLRSKIRLKRNELVWRFMPEVMFRHYRHQNTKTEGIGNDNYPTIGIFSDIMGLHESYIKAAEEMNIPYKVVDLVASNWLEDIKASGCKLFFVWPNPFHPAWKTMCDERIMVIERELGLHVYPRLEELWVWESKRRMSYWLAAHDIKQPKTWIFYDYDESIRFANETQLPIVFKPDFGDCARGVRIVQSRCQAIGLAKQAFSRGFHVEGHHPNDRIWGCAIFQQYIPDAREWRVIRIGDSILCQRKGKKGDFHSGTRLVEYDTPSKTLLDFVMEICDERKFDCMSIDTLEDKQGNFYALELQTVFGVDPWGFYMVIDGVPGRYRIEDKQEKYHYSFVRGIFSENKCCNLRIRDGILKYYGIDVGFWEKPGELEQCIDLARTKYRHLITMGF